MYAISIYRPDDDLELNRFGSHRNRTGSCPVGWVTQMEIGWLTIWEAAVAIIQNSTHGGRVRDQQVVRRQQRNFCR